jgi:hypothetical protein
VIKSSHHQYEVWDTVIALVVGVLLIVLIEPTTFMQQFFEAVLVSGALLIAAANFILYIHRSQ